MEKVQIVRYALMQIAALIYSVLAAGAAVKLDKQVPIAVVDLPSICHWAAFVSDYGFLFLIIVVIWTVVVSYLSSPFAKLEVGEGTLTWSGIIIAILIAIAGTMIAFLAAYSPYAVA